MFQLRQIHLVKFEEKLTIVKNELELVSEVFNGESLEEDTRRALNKFGDEDAPGFDTFLTNLLKDSRKKYLQERQELKRKEYLLHFAIEEAQKNIEREENIFLALELLNE